MRIGIFGGAFDPFHHGHYAILQAVYDDDALGLDRVLVVPSYHSPYKGMITPLEQRAKLIRIALDDAPEHLRRFCIVDEIEGELGATTSDVPTSDVPTSDVPTSDVPTSDVPTSDVTSVPSYTYNTVEALKGRYPDGTEFVFVCGADAFQGVPSWYRYADLLAMVTFAVVPRHGVDISGVLGVVRGEFGASSVHTVAMAGVGASSSAVRNHCHCSGKGVATTTASTVATATPLQTMLHKGVADEVRKMYCENPPKSDTINIIDTK